MGICLRFSFTRLAILAAFSFCLALQPGTANAQRLSSSEVPTHYTLKLTPDLKTATFSGFEKIDVNLAEPAKVITLNAAELEIQSVVVFPNGPRQTGTVTFDKDKQQASFAFPKPLPAGSATLEIHFTGVLNNELRGFYLSKTARRNYAVTQFESTDARRAFPCFDEPAFKARFDISLVVDANDTAISNGQIVSDTFGPGAGKHTLEFATTPRMSTYLVAFLVGDFECTAGNQDGVDIRVCSTPDKVALTAYGVGIAKYMLHYYNDYFGIPYPLKKLDLIALPDFEAGAMENFGAITYREADLLIDPKVATVEQKVNVSLVIAHEMAHQWFGDLVTMKWWDNIWLNEGFATWMENKSVAAMHPEWNMPLMVAAGEQGTLDLDAQATTRAIRARADTPDQIEQMFDGISYGKAGAVLLMVEHYLGEETFRKGVHEYLAAHLYANATAEDFWNAQTTVSGKPVDKIMDSLVAQPGEPIVSFGEPAEGNVSVSQKRFYLSPSAKPDERQKWTIPVCFKSAGCEVLAPSDTSLPYSPAKLFYANAEGKGYYRSDYTPSEFAALVAQVESGLKPAERISLIGDQWARVRANQAPVGDYLNLAAAARNDSNADVTSVALNGVNAVYHQLASTPEERAALSAWIDKTYTPMFYLLGQASGFDTDDKRRLRAALLVEVGSYGHSQPVIRLARHVAELYLADPASIDSTYGQAALTVAARNGDAALFDRLQKVYETSDNPQLKIFALQLLAQFPSPELEKRALDYAASGAVRSQDARNQFTLPLQGTETRDLAWDYMKTNWDKVQAQITIGAGGRLIDATGDFCTAAARDDVKNFFAVHKVAASDASLRHAVENIDGCIEFRTLQEPKLEEWLKTASSR
jgi:aminopeptidase N/puromycin-sensitive aminopeptidase